MAQSNESKKSALPVADTVIALPIAEVWADFTRNYRGHGKRPSEVDPDGLASLQKNLRSLGPLSALTVVAERQEGGKGKYRVQAGYRRFEAITNLHAANKEDPRFSVVPVIIKTSAASVEIDGEEGEKNEDGTPKKAPIMALKIGARALEAVRAQSENDQRTATSAWERVDTVRSLLSEGLSAKEVTRFFADEGVSLDVSTMFNYCKVATLSKFVADKCRERRSEGYKFAVKLTGPEYNLATAKEPKWDQPKQKAAVAAQWPEVKEGDPKPVKEKKAKFSMKPQEVIDRRERIEQCGADTQLIAFLDYLVGKSGPGDLAGDVGATLANAICGKVEADLKPKELRGKPRAKKPLHWKVWGLFRGKGRKFRERGMTQYGAPKAIPDGYPSRSHRCSAPGLHRLHTANGWRFRE